jgi:hypothetical protein
VAARRGKSEETKFLRGETGVDGAATAETVEPEVAEQARAQEALLRGRAWLGRECLTWLLWKSESTQAIASVEKQEVRVVFAERLTLRSASAEVKELVVKGVTAPYTRQVRHAIAAGLLVHGARVQLTWGEQVHVATLDAESFDVRAAKLPALLQEEESERLTERLELAARLGALLDALVQAFLAARLSRGWEGTVVPALLAWARAP